MPAVPTSTFVVELDNPSCTDRAIAGGKAASLGRLRSASLPVPPGFAITTDAYAQFIALHGILETRRGLIDAFDYEDAVRLEEQTARIREDILAAPVPAEVEREILAAYRELGDDSFVAIRSSATAEDMDDASFAGLHDTFLDVRGEGEVLDAVRRCWASLWTARCTAYRHRAGIDHLSAQIAVVLQQMVDAQVAGVVFTANPLTANTAETVVNASYGLGEGVVSGILTPDEFVVASKTRRVRRRTLGAKESEVVRAPSGVGTEVRPTDAQRRERYSLTDEQVAELVELADRAMEFYGGFPQDVEWALSDGEFHLLQSRPITGANFTWDEDVDGWQQAEDRDETTWTHAWAQAYWTGGITPLFYSVRARELTESPDRPRYWTLLGFDDLKHRRYFRYHRGTAYYNADVHAAFVTYAFPRFLRSGAVELVPLAWREQVLQQPWGLKRAARMWYRVKFHGDGIKGPLAWFSASYDLMNKPGYADGPSPARLRTMSDIELKEATQAAMERTATFISTDGFGFFLHAPLVFALMDRMLEAWYDGGNTFAAQELTSGLPQRTAQVDEAVDLWAVASVLTDSPGLRRLLDEAEPGTFFEACEHTEEGCRFLEVYRPFVRKWGHRGAADRDIYYPRRSEDPAIDQRALRLLTRTSEALSPEENEERLVARREEVTREVMDRVRRTRFGRFKVRLLGMVQAWLLRFLVLRDDEREMMDRLSMAKKRHFAEVGRRLHERGVIHEPDDYYFLAEHELWGLLAGEPATALTQAKIVGRRRAFERFNRREDSPPDFLRAGQPVDLDDHDDESATRFVGTALSRGDVTGRARVIPDLAGIGEVQKGDVLICNATDPGWASVFSLIGALVMETGGALAHGACLSREYGLPAVTVPRALQRIPDGALVRVVGDTGEVQILDEPAEGHAVLETDTR